MQKCIKNHIHKALKKKNHFHINRFGNIGIREKECNILVKSTFPSQITKKRKTIMRYAVNFLGKPARTDSSEHRNRAVM